MDIYIRRRKSRPTTTHIVTFVFGFALGFSLCYAAFFAPSNVPDEPPQLTRNDSEPIEPPAPPPVETSETPPVADAATESPSPGPTQPAADDLEDIEDTWPARHLFIAVKGTKLDDKTKDLLEDLKPGGVILTDENISNKNQTVALVNSIKAAVGLGDSIDSLPLIAVSQEGGKARNWLRLPKAPSASQIGKSDDLQYARAVGLDFAQSCENRKIGVLLAPVLDVDEDGAPDDLTERAFGTDFPTVRSFGLAFADGVTNGHVIPVVKHFPGRGAARKESGADFASIPQDRPLAEVVFPFTEAAAKEIPGILIGHIAVPALDMNDPTRPASLSPVLVANLLRETWRYNGVVLADDIADPAIVKSRTLETAAVQAVAAGCDAAILLDTDPEHVRAVCAAIDDAVIKGTITRRQLSDSKKRLDSWQEWLRKPKPGLKGPLPPLPTETQVAANVTVPLPETPTAPEAAAPAPTDGRRVHTVASGDILIRIAEKYGVTVDDILEANNIRKTTTLRVGQELMIPASLPASAQPEPESATGPAPAEPETAPGPAEPEPAVETTPEEPGEPDSAAPPDDEPPLEEPTPKPPAGTKSIAHTVKRGEYLAAIASKYNVQYQDIMKWNGMNDTRLREGDALTIHVPEDFVIPEDVDAELATDAAPAPPSEPLTPPAEPADEAAATAPTAEPEPSAAPTGEVPAEITYEVQSGDYLGKIGKKFDVTVDELKEWNSLETISLDVGQKLIIRPRKMP